MGDEIKPAVIKKTQDALGKFVKKPPLTEKLLRKPPFRFLHDIITTVIRETKFLDGLFNNEEMNSDNVKDKESKIAFLQKVIDVVNLTCGVSLSARPTKIVAGCEPEKTNELLQVIGRAIEKKVDSSAAVQRVLSKSKGSHKTESASVTKSQVKKEEPAKAKKSSGTIKRTTKEQHGSTQNLSKPVPKTEGKEKRSTVPNKETKDKRTKLSDEKTKSSTKNVKEESKSKVHVSREKRKSIDANMNSNKVAVENKEVKVEDKEANIEDKDSTSKRGHTKGEESLRKISSVEEEGNERIGRKNTIEMGEEVEDACPSLEPPVSEKDPVPSGEAAKNTSESALVKTEDTDKIISTKKKNSASSTRNGGTRASSGQRMAISTPVLRPSSVMSNHSSRPRSSRPHAPRLRSALGGLIPASDQDKAVDRIGKEIMVEQPRDGILGGGDNNPDDADEKEFLVEEARPTTPSLPHKDMKHQVGEGSEMLSLESDKQQGVLVAKILETKKELEGGIEETEVTQEDHKEALKRVGIEYEEDEMRRRRKGAGDMENLQSLVQSIARSAHPLGSLLGMVQGNVEAMRSETTKWRNECENLLKQLKEEEKNMELELEPLRNVLLEVEQRVAEEREALSAAKVRVMKAEQRIQIILDPQENGQTKGMPASFRVS